MCIIVVKPGGIEFPNDGTLDYCFRRNPDGAGIMLADQGRLIIRKGLMTRDEFFDTDLRPISGVFCPLFERFSL